jgi:hypothetical protein
MKWEPEDYDKDPMVNAVLNVAAQLADCATATRGLLYAFKYSKDTGLSVAEALEVSSQNVANGLANGLASLAEALANR